MKSTTTKASLAGRIKTGNVLKAFGLALVMTFAGIQFSIAQKSTAISDSDQTDQNENGLKNPGTGLTPVKSITPAPIVFCPSLSGVNMLDKSYSHIVMGWDSHANFDSIMVRVTETGTSNARIIAISGRPNPGRTFVQGLTGLTTYTIEISTRCQTGAVSAWSAPVTITTFAEPAPKLSPVRSSNPGQDNPNPATGHTLVSFAGPAHVQHTVSIVSIFGHTIFKTVVSSGDGKIQLPLDLTGITPGYYYVQVQAGATVFSKNLVIM